MTRRQRGVRGVMCILGTFLGIVGWLLWREIRQQRLDAALIASIKRNDPAAVTSLLGLGADVNANDFDTDKRPYWLALLDRQRGVSTPRMSAPSALLVALNLKKAGRFSNVYQDTSPIVKALLDRGADTRVITKTGETPLFLAAKHEQWKIAGLLLEKDVQVEANDAHGETPLMLAVYAKQNSLVRRLIEKGARIDSRDEDGDTTLHAAVSSGDLQTVQLLLNKGMPVNVVNEWRETPLHRAAEAGNVEIVHLLLDRGANVNAHDYLRDTPLMGAADSGSVSCVRLLLDRGADINAIAYPPGEGTALMYAVIAGHLGAIKLLVARGANVNTSITPIVYHAKPTSPLSYARDSDRADIIEVLKRAGAKELSSDAE